MESPKKFTETQRWEESAKDKKVREEAFRSLEQKYNIDKVSVELLSKIWKVERIFGGLDNIKEKRILDLGCGSVPSEETLELIKRVGNEDMRAVHELSAVGAYDILIGGDNPRTFEP
jgi:hypothetical protein